MIKNFLLAITILGLYSCSTTSETSFDYFGQSYPGADPIVFAPGIISIQGRLEHGISFSPDKQELAFGILNTEDFSGAIYYSSKQGDSWAEPDLMQPMSNTSVFLPYFTPLEMRCYMHKAAPTP